MRRGKGAKRRHNGVEESAGDPAERRLIKEFRKKKKKGGEKGKWG